MNYSMEQQKKKFRIDNESMEHKFAKEKYAESLRSEWLRVDVERIISREWFYYFTPDIAVYDENGIAGIYEVVFTHDIDLTKMNRIYNFAKDCMRPLFLRTIKAENIISDNYVFLMDIIL